ncbi:i-kappa-B kinase [Caerostris extrusa]|uniref:I-kappa-B kinase n=1 Tax=Caerostris extrusa TaxID=172846 RepID=A0AAV4QQ51_CAEEX|nr:i-kappa-B kinase [Caerostris extrusa]
MGFQKRGIYDENINTFNLLETMLNKKISLVFCVETLRLHSILISKTMTLEDFYKKLEQETKIPEEEETIFFLFDKSQSQSSESSPLSTVIPPAVENMMRHPHVKVEYQMQRTVWSQAIYLSQQEFNLVSRLIQGFKANL